MEDRSIARVERVLRAFLRDLVLRAGDRIVMAVSGGPDSVALLHALKRLQGDSPDLVYELTAAHLNHRLRASESERDERFVRALCDRLEVPLAVERAQELRGVRSNLEERARELRYEFLNRVADRLGAVFIATAHQADDQSETVMLRLLRGSGAAGLGAIAPRGPGRLIRPFLDVTRKDVIDYLQAIGADYVTDSSNSSAVHLRNRMRTDLLPMLEREYAPGFGGRLVELAREMRELDDFIVEQARCELARRRAVPSRLNLAGFGEIYPALASAVLREFLRETLGGLRHIRRVQIETLLRVCTKRGARGSAVVLPGGWTFRREHEMGILRRGINEPAAAGNFAVDLCSEGTTIVESVGLVFSARIIDLSQPGAGRSSWKAASAQEAHFDAEAAGQLTARSFVRGDRIGLFGGGGRRKVHDVFIDGKLPIALRSRWPIVTSGGKIAWIPGFARSPVAIVTPETHKALYLRVTPCANALSPSLLGN
jgi:tRNA(Ile)-lysidine synthase